MLGSRSQRVVLLDPKKGVKPPPPPSIYYALKKKVASFYEIHDVPEKKAIVYKVVKQSD